MKHPLIALAFVLLSPSAVIAETDGNLSADESEGTFEIFLTVTAPQQIQITNLADATFDLEPNDTAAEKSSAPCIYMSGPVNTYDITLHGEPLSDSANTYAYSVKFESFDGQTATNELLLNVGDTQTSVNDNNIPASSAMTCSGDRTTKISVNLEETPPLDTTNGKAEATVTVTVAPSA